MDKVGLLSSFTVNFHSHVNVLKELCYCIGYILVTLFAKLVWLDLIWFCDRMKYMPGFTYILALCMRIVSLKSMRLMSTVNGVGP